MDDLPLDDVKLYKKTPEEAREHIKDAFSTGNYLRVMELIELGDKNHQLTIEILIIKLRTLVKLGRFEEALTTCNMVLFLQPTNSECHQMKISILKNLHQYNYLSDSLVHALKLFPNLSFS